jgi:hypothetical protein
MITHKSFDALLRHRQGALTLMMMMQGVVILTVNIDDGAGCTHIDGAH